MTDTPMLGDLRERTGNPYTGYAPLPVGGALSRAPGYPDEVRRPRMAFFTDTTVCIGCKACEVACKEWNDLPESLWELTGHSYDNTGHLSANAWRHVAFIEQPSGMTPGKQPSGMTPGKQPSGMTPGKQPSGMTPGEQPSGMTPGEQPGHLAGGEVMAHTAAIDAHVDALATDGFRWLMMSDVCKHCTTAGCLDNCPTGALFRTEFDSVVVQADVCNGCGYCVVGCPYGVISRRESDGKAWKCTMCYDRLRTGDQPACAKTCPTDSINFGSLDAMRLMAAERLEQVVALGYTSARLYGEADGDAVGVDGTGALFLLLDEPEVYGLPPAPVVATKHLAGEWGAAFAAAGALVLALVGAFGSRGRR